MKRDGYDTMKNFDMNCWICGDKGTPGEHLIKASDIKMLFPDISQKKPAYKHTSNRKNIPIGSKKSNRLKSNALICKKCNNQRTQAYDSAWESLSCYIYDNWNTINQTNRIDLRKAFSGCIEGSAKNFHLYFLKLFGCLLVESKNYKIANEFAISIRTKDPHNDVFIFFVKTADFIGQSCVGISDLDVIYFDGSNLIRASWVYMIGELSLRIVYLHPDHSHLEPIRGWNPKYLSDVINITNIG